MKFPSLETMIMYGIYTVKDLLLYTNDRLQKRNIVPLNECVKCSFVYSGNACHNCMAI